MQKQVVVHTNESTSHANHVVRKIVIHNDMAKVGTIISKRRQRKMEAIKKNMTFEGLDFNKRPTLITAPERIEYGMNVVRLRNVMNNASVYDLCTRTMK